MTCSGWLSELSIVYPPTTGSKEGCRLLNIQRMDNNGLEPSRIRSVDDTGRLLLMSPDVIRSPRVDRHRSIPYQGRSLDMRFGLKGAQAIQHGTCQVNKRHECGRKHFAASGFAQSQTLRPGRWPGSSKTSDVQTTMVLSLFPT